MFISSLAHRPVSLDKELYSTLSLFIQEFKWVPATYCWGITLRWTHHSVKSGGGGGEGEGGVAILLFYYLKVTNIIQSWTRRILKMKKYVNSSDLIFRNCARINLMFMKTVQKHSVSFNPKRQGTSNFFFVWDCNHHSFYLPASKSSSKSKKTNTETNTVNQ